jgi:DNA invertase Pin-like site-specific DNA recombinase
MAAAVCDLKVDGLVGLCSRLLATGGAGLSEDAEGEWRADHLVVARESDAWDLQLLEGMIFQTLGHYDAIPGRDSLLKLGVGPVRKTPAGGYLIVEGKSRAVLFEHQGTWCLYSQGSAASADGPDGDNGFCRILERVLEELRPRHLYIATFSRLVRNSEFAGGVMAAARKHVGVLHCREMTDLRPGDERDRIFFTMLTMFSDMERTQQMTRLTLGLLAKAHRGEFLDGPRAVPLGYRMLPGHRVVVDPRARHVVDRLLRLLAEPGLTALDIARAMEPTELAPPAVTGDGWAYKPAHGGEWGPEDADLAAGLAAARASGRTNMFIPKDQVRKWYRQLPLYLDGKWVKFRQVPAGSAARFGRHDVVRLKGKGQVRPCVRTELNLGIPDGGWAPTDVLEAAARRAAANAERQSGPLANKTLLPLLGSTNQWEADGRIHAVRYGMGRDNCYSVVSIDAEKAREMGASRRNLGFDGWERDGVFHGVKEGMMRADELHASIGRAAVEALRTGVALSVLPDAADWRLPSDGLGGLPLAEAPSAEIREAAVEKAEKLAARRFANYSNYTGDDERYRESLRVASEEAAAALRTAEARRDDADFAEPDLQPPPDLVQGPADLLLSVLARLGKTPGVVPRAVAESMCTVLRNLRVTHTPVWVDWRVDVHIPTRDGVLVLGPLTGRVRNRLAAKSVAADVDGTAAASNDAREDALLSALFADGQPITSLMEVGGVHGRRQRLRLAQRLHTAHGMPPAAAKLLTACGVQPTRKAVWAMSQGQTPEQAAATAGVTVGFAEHLRRFYLEADPPTAASWWNHVEPRDDVIEVMLEAGGSIPRCRAKATFRSARLPDHHVFTLLNNVAPPGLTLFTVLPPDGMPHCDSRRCEGNRLSLRRCIHCGGWANRRVSIPEVTAGLLCPSCLRMPTPDSPVFPAEYATLSKDTIAAAQEPVAPDLALYQRKCAERKIRKANGEPPPNRAKVDPGTVDIRLWAAEKGIQLRPSRPVPRFVWARYADEQAGSALPPSQFVRPARNALTVRAWNIRNGHDVPARGRLPASAYARYDTAMDETRNGTASGNSRGE